MRKSIPDDAAKVLSTLCPARTSTKVDTHLPLLPARCSRSSTAQESGTMKQCNPDSVNQLAPHFVLADGPSCAAWASPRLAHVIQLTDQRMGEAVALDRIKSCFTGRAIGPLPDAVREMGASAASCSLFYKLSMDLRTPVVVRCAQADVRRK
jgi:hypothetical protein